MSDRPMTVQIWVHFRSDPCLTSLGAQETSCNILLIRRYWKETNEWRPFWIFLVSDIHWGLLSTGGSGLKSELSFCLSFQISDPSRREKKSVFHKHQVCLVNSGSGHSRTGCRGTEISSTQCQKVLFLLRPVPGPSSVDFEDTEDVRRGRRTSHPVETEGRACDGLELRASVQPQETGHLAGLDEVEVVRSSRGRGGIALYALQLLRPLTWGHHVQLHIRSLLLIEQHLPDEQRLALFLQRLS